MTATIDHAATFPDATDVLPDHTTPSQEISSPEIAECLPPGPDLAAILSRLTDSLAATRSTDAASDSSDAASGKPGATPSTSDTISGVSDTDSGASDASSGASDASSGASDASSGALGELTDHDLVSVLIGWRRLSSWAQAAELEVVAELEARAHSASRRGMMQSQVTAAVGSEIALALTLTEHSAAVLQGLAYALVRTLPATGALLKSGAIDLPRARVIATGLTGVSQTTARAVEAAVLPHAPRMTTGRLRAFVAEKLAELAPDEVIAKAKAAQKDRRVEVREDGQGTCTLLGLNLPLVAAVAAANRITALAKAFKNNGDPRTMDQLRADVLLMCMLGQIPGPHAPTAGSPTNTPPPSTPSSPEPTDTRPTTTSPDINPSAATPSGTTPTATSSDATPTATPSSTTPTATPSGTTHTAAPAGTAPTATPDGTETPTDAPSTAGLSTCRADGGAAPTYGEGKNGGTRHDEHGAQTEQNERNERRAQAEQGCTDDGGALSEVPWPQTPSREWWPEIAYADVIPASDHPDIPDPLAQHRDPREGPHGDGDPVKNACDEEGRPDAEWVEKNEANNDWGGESDADNDNDWDENDWDQGDGAPTPGWLLRAAAQRFGGPHIVVTLPALLSLADTPGRLGGYAPLVADIVRQILQQQHTTDVAACQWTVTDTGGVALYHGQTRYRPNAPLRRLIQARDQTCRFPNCRRPAANCDLDHTRPYDQGGFTCACNMAPLCRRHHQVKQAPGWSLTHPEPGVLVWKTPTGRTYTARPDPYPT